MNLVRWMILTLFFGLAGCGGTSPASLVPNQPPSDLIPCTTCTHNKIASHAIVFTGMDAATKDALALAASASHAGMIRMDMTWATLQPSATEEYDWRWADESIQAAKKNNLEILALITETPIWASSNSSSPDARF